MEGIKTRLFQVLQRTSDADYRRDVVEVLARDALAEIEQLEKDRDLHVLLARGAIALEGIAKRAESIDETLVLILHKLPNANE